MVLSSEFKGQEYACIRTEMKIGRTDDNDIVIDHRSLSRTHAKLVREENGEWRIIDMQSANGMTVNGEPYAQASLNNGDIVELGHVKLRFVGAGEAAGALSAGGRSKMPLVAALWRCCSSWAARAYYFLLRPGPEQPPGRHPILAAAHPPEQAAARPSRPPREPDAHARRAHARRRGRGEAAGPSASSWRRSALDDQDDLDKAEDTLRPAQNPDGAWPPEVEKLAGRDRR